MGLDTVELILRCEEVFEVEIPDSKLEEVRTVGEYYNLICNALNLTPIADPTPDTGTDRLARGILNLAVVHWNPEDVWATLVAVIVDQLQVEHDEVTYSARFLEDLGSD